MRRLIFAAILAVALIAPAVTSGADPSSFAYLSGDTCFLLRQNFAARDALLDDALPADADPYFNDLDAVEAEIVQLTAIILQGGVKFWSLPACPPFSRAEIDLAWSISHSSFPWLYPSFQSALDTAHQRGIDTRVSVARSAVAPALTVPKTNAYAAAIAKLRVYIANLERSGSNPARLALYRARLADYLSR